MWPTFTTVRASLLWILPSHFISPSSSFLFAGPSCIISCINLSDVLPLPWFSGCFATPLFFFINMHMLYGESWQWELRVADAHYVCRQLLFASPCSHLWVYCRQIVECSPLKPECIAKGGFWATGLFPWSEEHVLTIWEFAWVLKPDQEMFSWWPYFPSPKVCTSSSNLLSLVHYIISWCCCSLLTEML